ncbi:unnamed protein product, partial [marine sediment metagenome]
MAKICMLLTTTHWGDQRQFYKQAPALVQGGHEVVFMAGQPDGEINPPFEYHVLSNKSRRRARFAGALNLFRKIRKLKPDCVQLCSIEQLPLGLALKLLTRIQVVYDC